MGTYVAANRECKELLACISNAEAKIHELVAQKKEAVKAKDDRAPQGEGTPHVRKLSNPRVPKIMLEGGLCRESERPITTVHSTTIRIS